MTLNKSKGVLLGVACGDALGRAVEFKSPEEIHREYGTLTDMVGQGTWNKPAGTVTDDTNKMLCIARSLVENKSFVPEDISKKFVKWYNSGPFDIGNMTRDALSRLRGNEEEWRRVGKEVYEDLRRQPNAGAGNGSVMRCAPIAVAYREDTDSLFHASMASSWITHADPRCTYGCALINRVTGGLLNGENKQEALDSGIEFCREKAENSSGVTELLNAVENVESLGDEELSNSGYVVDTVQSSLHYALIAENFEDAIVKAVNAGGDTDTIGAVAGGVAGARFGESDIPERWTNEVDETEEISELAQGLSEDGYDRFYENLSY